MVIECIRGLLKTDISLDIVVSNLWPDFNVYGENCNKTKFLKVPDQNFGFATVHLFRPFVSILNPTYVAINREKDN